MAIHHRRSERVATTILLCAAALLRLGDGDSSALTWCTGGRRDPGAGYSKFAYTLDMAINATLAASDRSAVAATKEEVQAGLKPDFALAQCRPDVTADQCFRCLGGHRDGLVPGAGGDVCATGGARDGICLLRYDVAEFSSIFDQDERMGSVYGGAAVAARPGLTKDVVYGLLDKLVANDTLANGSRAVAGIADYPDGGAVYGLAQCLTQLSAPDCNRCLRDALFRLLEQFNSSAGMQVLRPSCMVQYNNSIFFNTSLLPVIHVSFPDAPASSPSPSSSQAAPSSKHGRSFRIGLVAAVAAAAFALAAALALCFFTRRQRNRKSTGAGNYRYQDLVAATRNFSDENRLGSGGCGVVYKGALEIGQEIAVKKLTNKGLRESEREVSLVAELQHENLVKFLGHCFHEGGMFLIYEYLTNKDLGYYFIDSGHRKKLEWPKWFNIIEGIARGLTYLHRDSGKNIIHRDLKPSNILLDSNFTAKIADFDLAREYNRDKIVRSEERPYSGHRKKLEWPKWFNIIKGIARGLTYLHRDSGKNIIHRDLKPSNILLDSNFTAKIADFDLAREYNRDKSHESTRKTAGTLGYMAPECVWSKEFSTKSDVYSYGVVVLSIIVGYSVRAFETESSTNLVHYVWLKWDGGRVENMLDRDHLGIVTDEQMRQALRCVHVALLCVQKAKHRRPAMEDVVHFLNAETCLPDRPSAPGFFSPDDHGGMGN